MKTMKTLNTITKEREIKLLTELLNADSYLGYLFSGELDLEHIIKNITNDFPIERDTKLAGRMQEMLDERDNQMLKHRNLCEALLVYADDPSQIKDAEQRVKDEIGVDATIRAKRHLGIALSNDDIDYLMTKIQ